MSDSETTTVLDPLFRAQQALVDGTIETQRSIHNQGLKLTRESTEALVGVFLPDSEESAPVVTLNGIGATYSSRLEEAGFGTARDLAAASVADVADAAQVGTDRAAEWIERAQKYD